VIVENCLRCGAKNAFNHLLCSKCEAQNDRNAKLEDEMFKQNFAHIETLCSVCQSTSVYMNDQNRIFCPVCSLDIDPMSLRGRQNCLKCNRSFEANFSTGSNECSFDLCHSKELGETPLEIAKKRVPEWLSTHQLQPKKKSLFVGIVLGIGYLISRLFVTPTGIALLIVSALVLWFSTNTSSGSVDSAEEAVAVCQVNVKKQLRDPGSATFVSSSAQRTSSGWISTGIVRGTNGFGALDARTYVCAITSEGVEVAIR
jgi:hypothetical protein